MVKTRLFLISLFLFFIIVIGSLAKSEDLLVMASEQPEGDYPPAYIPYLTHKPFLPLMNGGFESGPVYWTPDLPPGATRTLIYEAGDLPIAPHSGNWMAWFESEGIDGVYYLTQEVTIPEDATYLSFWHWDDVGSHCGDKIGVTVSLCGLIIYVAQCTPQWRNKLYDVSSCAGETQNLKIGLNSYGLSDPDTVFIDDIQFLTE